LLPPVSTQRRTIKNLRKNRAPKALVGGWGGGVSKVSSNCNTHRPHDIIQKVNSPSEKGTTPKCVKTEERSHSCPGRNRKLKNQITTRKKTYRATKKVKREKDPVIEINKFKKKAFGGKRRPGQQGVDGNRVPYSGIRGGERPPWGPSWRGVDE